MKKKLPKSKRPTHFLQPKKSSVLSSLSLKKTPKRKIKNIARKIILHTTIALGSFLLSLGILSLVAHHTSIILNPVSQISQVLGTKNTINTNAVLAQTKDALSKHNLDFLSVDTQGDDIDIQLQDGTEVLCSSEKDISSQIDSLQVTIDNLTIEGKHISRVDMRFERPVVTFK